MRKYLFDNRWVFDTGDQLDGTGIFAASISLLEGPQLAYSVEKLDDEVSDFAVLISMRGLFSG